MNRRLLGMLGVVAALVGTLAGCKEDPLSGLDGTPATLVLNFSYLQLPVGGSASVTASVVDGRFTPLLVPITFTACSADVTVGVDTSYHPIPATSARARVTAVSANPSCVRVSGGGLEDTVGVAVLPVSFGGALSSTTPKGGDTLTINSTSVLKFNAATTTVTFGGGKSPVVLSQTADVIKVLVPFSSPGALAISNINVTYVAGLSVTLNTAQTVTQTGSRWTPADTGYATAPQIALPTTTGGKTYFVTDILGSYNNDANCGEGTGAGGIGICAIFKYVATGTDSLSFSVDWEGAALAPDMDIYSCGSAGVSACFEDSGSGATASKPQVFRLKPTAGTHYYVVEVYGGTPPTNVVTTITKLN